jgi:hypothetical protein
LSRGKNDPSIDTFNLYIHIIDRLKVDNFTVELKSEKTAERKSDGMIELHVGGE